MCARTHEKPRPGYKYAAILHPHGIRLSESIETDALLLSDFGVCVCFANCFELLCLQGMVQLCVSERHIGACEWGGEGSVCVLKSGHATCMTEEISNVVNGFSSDISARQQTFQFRSLSLHLGEPKCFYGPEKVKVIEQLFSL